MRCETGLDWATGYWTPLGSRRLNINQPVTSNKFLRDKNKTWPPHRTFVYKCRLSGKKFSPALSLVDTATASRLIYVNPCFFIPLGPLALKPQAQRLSH